MQTWARVANSHAYGVILTHLTCYSRTHAIGKFTHAFKKITRILTQFYKIENNKLCFIIVRLIGYEPAGLTVHPPPPE